MAHEISIRANGKAEMAYVGDTPWHGLGQAVTKGASVGVWAKEAGMDWKALEAPVMFPSYGEPSQLQVADGYKMLYRSDTAGQLAIVGDKYEVVQPADVLEFFRTMVEHDGWWIHTAGVLRGGRKVWAMATNGDTGNVGKGDPVKRNILLATSLDGSMRTTAMETTVRVVCNNTLTLALNKGNNNMVTVSHRSVFDADAVRSALNIRTDIFNAFIVQARELAETPIQLDQARDILRQVFKVEAPEQVKPRLAWLGDLSKIDLEPEAKESRTVSRVLELFDGAGKGAGLKTANGTRWGLLNAVTEHVDHEMGRTDDSRLDAAWFGRGAGFKRDALELLTA